MIRGHHHNGRYIPEPSVARFEELLGRVIGAIPCGLCGEPLGDMPSYVQYHHAKLHPACFAKLTEGSE